MGSRARLELSCRITSETFQTSVSPISGRLALTIEKILTRSLGLGFSRTCAELAVKIFWSSRESCCSRRVKCCADNHAGTKMIATSASLLKKPLADFKVRASVFLRFSILCLYFDFLTEKKRYVTCELFV